MRLLVPILLVPVVAGCSSDFRSKYKLPTDCERSLFFEDRDGDGWGDPDGVFESRCEADPEQNLTARNNLDCDDDDASVSGRTASLCPGELVSGGTDYVGAKALSGEVVVVLPTADFSHVSDPEVAFTETIWADGAASACSELGWGGGLATFDSFGEFSTVADLVEARMADEGTDYYAAWVGAVPDGSDGWRWEDAESGEGLDIGVVGMCAGAPSPGTTSDPGLRLAMVKAAGEDWCFGYPSDANPEDLVDGELAYGDRQAHFVCERGTPLPRDFNINVAPTE